MFITQAELAEHRADAEARMGAANGGSDVRIRRRAGRGPQGGDGREAPAWATTYAWLPARLAGRRGASTSSTDRSGDVEVQRAMRTLSLPATWLHPGEEQPRRLDVDDGDLIEVLAGENAGQVVRVDEADWQDQATALRLPVIAADRPLEWDEGGA